jgi:hypothetical protein
MANEKNRIKQITAVEYSEIAVNSAWKRLTDLCSDLSSLLTIECNDLFTFMNKLESNTIDGIYANSVFHFLTPKQRQDVYYQADVLSAELQSAGFQMKSILQ